MSIIAAWKRDSDLLNIDEQMLDRVIELEARVLYLEQRGGQRTFYLSE